MSPRARLLLFIGFGVAFGIYVGIGISNESYFVAEVAVVTSVYLLLSRMGSAAPEAWFLGAGLLGYIVGNRGFAQLQLSSQFPLFPAEAVLLVAVPCLILRIAFKREQHVRPDALNYALLLWIALGVLRIPLDVSRYGAMALRDFAMIYYASFFFVGQSLGSDRASSRLLRSSLTAGFALLLPVVVVIALNPDLLLDHLIIRGNPLIYHKGDLVATSLAAGFFWLWTRAQKSGRRAWYLAAGASLLLIGVVPSPRAAMAALVVANLFWMAGRHWRIVATQAALVVAGSLAALALAAFSGRDLRTTAPYSAYEHAVSIFDVSGSGTYVNAESGDPGANNQFRLVWWREVAGETLSTSPIFGLGFGADLASRFLAQYDPLSDESFSARSPHSMVLSVLGRMGTVGTLAWGTVATLLGLLAWRLFATNDPDALGLASIVCVTGVSACFGVVLEGPMGAIVFWTAAGMCSALWHGRSRPAQGVETPVANPAALGSHLASR